MDRRRAPHRRSCDLDHREVAAMIADSRATLPPVPCARDGDPMDEAPPPDRANSAEATRVSNPDPRPSAAQAPDGDTGCGGDDRLRRLLDATGIIPWEADP